MVPAANSSAALQILCLIWTQVGLRDATDSGDENATELVTPEAADMYVFARFHSMALTLS